MCTETFMWKVGPPLYTKPTISPFPFSPFLFSFQLQHLLPLSLHAAEKIVPLLLDTPYSGLQLHFPGFLTPYTTNNQMEGGGGKEDKRESKGKERKREQEQ